jgi:hypothetical protein
MLLRRAIPLLLLGACAAGPNPRFRDPTPAEWEAATFGEEPANYDTAIRAYMEGLLRDPRAATLVVRDGPSKAWVGTAPDFQYGYGVCVEVQERGVYGINTNFGLTFFLMLNGKVTQMREGSDGERLCARLGRIPDGVNEPK